MAAEEDRPGGDLSHRGNGIAQAGAILAGSGGRWRSERAMLPECHIAAQHMEAFRAEGLSQQDQQRRFAVSARAVSKNEAAPTGRFRRMEESLNGGFFKNDHIR